jgi:Galactoside-binding lectin
MSIRPDHQCIVRNSLENGNYGTEERFGGCPIQYGQSFDIAIAVDHATYNISINGVHYCHFNHRLALSRVQFIALGDGCTIHYIGHEMGGAPGAPIHRPIIPAPSMPSYPSMPYPNHPPAYPPAGGVQVLPIPVAPPPPPYSPAPIYPSKFQLSRSFGFSVLTLGLFKFSRSPGQPTCHSIRGIFEKRERLSIENSFFLENCSIFASVLYFSGFFI